MFEARLEQGHILKKVFDATKDLCTDVNVDCSETGISMQAMDASHVALVSMKMNDKGFNHFRCDKGMSLGLNMTSVSKIFKICNNDDTVTLRAQDEGDSISFQFESAAQERISDFELKLMDIDSEHLGIPDTEYQASITMPSSEFQRICRDMVTFGDTMNIDVSKDGVKFSVTGDIGTGNITLKPKNDAEKPEDNVIVEMSDKIDLAFGLKYLNLFAKATPLSPTVCLQMQADVPLTVEYVLGRAEVGHLRFYLAPKIDEDAEQQAQEGGEGGEAGGAEGGEAEE
uniref:DNA sliding clamp PCNA n=1 Tax=Chromera velia CCMP2878 TaxID=1169474 RepID=A0A0G4HYV8_9ALVE|mmetsp:Transcript_55783/g.109211  ORF Transcript_55783/g.109211 Transcript_55783/m.109211 type:complete len:285 (+) Transcript_55783:188-1042(+)|eukprot:Cvel_9578.t1-p1 / transcript=Cvel_9578.t1 / gene=Cvel_9578 / organism=Chromera_velia_CCMP2878 / gene_product=Proliferating cell nuclear antigen, putative / transcript_product=Proliferating cell nuclear antigen, putative / location=Cvel_scaffold555:48050-50914(+) / protein_length=284 / sequence_SO=supercontig / SO=protein_coding / is_pseudo=false